MTKVFEIETSCGKVFRQRADEMSDWQLSSLIKGNPDNSDTALLEEALTRRQETRKTARAA